MSAVHAAVPAPSSDEQSALPVAPRLEHEPVDAVDAPTEGASTAPARVPFDAAPICQGIAVHAIVASADPAWSFALLGSAGDGIDLRRRGQRVGDMRVVHVGAERVWLARRSSRDAYAVCQAELGPAPGASAAAVRAVATSSPAGASTHAPVLPSPFADRIVMRSPTEVALDRAARDWLVEHAALLAPEVRAAPELREGQMVGFRVAHVRPGSVLGRLGLRAGDVVTRIGAIDLTSTERVLEAYARLRDAPGFALGIARGGRPMQIDYEVN